MGVIIKLNGQKIAECKGSAILGLTAKQEAKLFIDSYKKIYGKIMVNGIEYIELVITE